MAYMNRGREEVSEYAKLAQDLGFAAVGITMDTVRPVKIGDEVPLSTKDGKPRRKDIEWMKQQFSLPVVIKGMMSAEDARTAVNAGADAVLVSNHGGRILDFNRAALEALPEVVDAVGAEVPVLLDSGIRSGADVFKALALGADAVTLGRPHVYGLAVAGREGVAEVVRNVVAELDLVMALTGTRTVAEIDRSRLAGQDSARAR